MSALGLTVSINQIGVEEAGKTVKGDLISHSRFSPDVHLLVGETTALIQSPDLPCHPKSGRSADPPQQSMHRRMDPGHDAWTMVKSQITTNGVVQQIADQNLIRKSHIRNESERASRDR